MLANPRDLMNLQRCLPLAVVEIPYPLIAQPESFAAASRPGRGRRWRAVAMFFDNRFHISARQTGPTGDICHRDPLAIKMGNDLVQIRDAIHPATLRTET
jgi:hypothetical protein